MESLMSVAAQIVAEGAAEYLRKNNLRADPSALASCCKSWCAIKLPEALRDAKEAMECGMDRVANQTFAATMVLAGIEAAKESGFPAGQE